jgi:hypothetical protein
MTILLNLQDASLAEIDSFLKSNGLYRPTSMLSVGSDSKTVKGLKEGYLTGILYLMPSNTICPASKLAKCREACLESAGRGKFNSVIKGRINKTKIYELFPSIFYELISRDVVRIKRKAEKEGLKYCVRLNGTSDLDHTTFIAKHSDTMFYDYTKSIANIDRKIAMKLDNYHITFSDSGVSERYEKHVINAIDKGFNIATVFRNRLPEYHRGIKVIDGDKTDLRFLDESNVVVGLTAKGKAKKDEVFTFDGNIIAKG